MLTVSLGPIMTAEQAKKQYCHHSRSKPYTYAQTCDADQCMAWMWLGDIRKGMLPVEQYRALFAVYEEGLKEGKHLGFCAK